MRPGSVGTICLLLLTAASPLALAGVAYDNPLAVYITFPDDPYEIGSDVPVTVHVFREGVRHDPGEVNLTVGEANREIPLTRQSEGLYNGTFTIGEEDIFWGLVPINAVARDGTDPVEEAFASKSILPRSLDRLKVTIVTPDDGTDVYGPGETIEFTVEVTFDGAPVEPDEGTLLAEYMDAEWNSIPVDLAPVSTGVYGAAIEVPDGLNESMAYDVAVMAEYTPADQTYSAEDYHSFYIDFLVLWLHYGEVTLTRTVFDIYVLDLDLGAVEGANVSFEYSYRDASFEDVTRQLAGTTDGDGKSPFTLEYPDISSGMMYMQLSGRAEAAGMTQVFDASYSIAATSDDGIPSEMMLYVDLLGDETLPPDTTMDLHFRAYSLGEALPDKDLFAYITDGESILYSGSVTTSANGELTVNVRTPPAAGILDPFGSSIDCDFQIEVEGAYESYTTSYIVMPETGIAGMGMYMDPRTTVTVEPFKLGDTAEVTVDHPDADGTDEMAGVLWGLGDIEAWREPPYAQWVSLDPASGEGGSILGRALCTWSGGAFHASILIPACVPEDMKVFFVGVIMFGDLEDMDIHAGTLGDFAPLPPNPSPVALITAPVAGEQYSGILAVTGTASDDTLVEGVEVRIDGGAWTPVTGTGTWSFEVNTTQLPSGTHTLEARAFDGDKHSPVVSVVFEVDQPPTVAITSPAPDTRTGGTLSVAGTAADDNAVDRVEYRVDAGAWDPATGTTAWTAEVAVATLTSGAHTLEVRSSDGERTSQTASLTFVVDTRPAVTITAPSNASTVKKAFELKGTAADDVAVTKVEGRLDGGAWTELRGTTSWSWAIPVKGRLAEGDHTLEVRSWDGYAYSELSSVTFKYSKPEDSPGATAALAALALLGAVGAASLAAQGRRR